VLTKKKEKQLLVFERKFFRTICSRKIENCVNRRRYNHEVEREFDSQNVLNVTKTVKLSLDFVVVPSPVDTIFDFQFDFRFSKTSRLRYAGHMIRRPEDLPQKAPLRAKPNERRNQGRPKSR
jgi:hypothetical protein